MMERLDKRLANTGRWSRKEARELIRSGRVAVDGAPCRAPEAKVGEEAAVTVDGAPVAAAGAVYLMLNKPAGVVSSTAEPGERTVLDLLGEAYQNIGLFPAGRLDKDTEGLLLLTNDGALAHRLLSPRGHVDKVYCARLNAPVTEEDIAAFAAGILLEDGRRCLPAALRAGEGTEGFVTLHEGKYHQIKRMFLSRGKTVLYLKRLSMGGVALDPGLGKGEYRYLTEAETAQLRKNTTICE